MVVDIECISQNLVDLFANRIERFDGHPPWMRRMEQLANGNRVIDANRTSVNVQCLRFGMCMRAGNGHSKVLSFVVASRMNNHRRSRSVCHGRVRLPRSSPRLSDGVLRLEDLCGIHYRDCSCTCVVRFGDVDSLRSGTQVCGNRTGIP